MDIYNDLMYSKTFEEVDITVPIYKTRAKRNAYYDNLTRATSANQHQYVHEIQQNEHQKLQEECLLQPLETDLIAPYNGPVNGLFDVESASSIAESLQVLHRPTSKYTFSRSASQHHLIAEHEENILNVIEAYPAVVIEGRTGCGKTTQVPQFILDKYCQENAPVNIVVTQPRRIAACSVAKRVCDERNWDLGTVVGFKVGMKASISADTRITFCTTGVLLQHLISKKHMNDFTHVIIDEVHERDQEVDFLLLLVRKMLRGISKQVKVILMSATFNSDKFSKYFCFSSMDKILNAPVIKIDSELKFPVDVYHLSEIRNILCGQEFALSSLHEAKFSAEMCQLILKLIVHLDVLEGRGAKGARGSVLVFLPGIHEIEDTFDELSKINFNLNKSWKILPLHSSITRNEQMTVFSAVSTGQRKIILSTNISESSITVPDVKYVIDTCLTKQLVTNSDTNISCLELDWASKVNCMQRKGRIGRVASGTVFRLITEEFYETLRDEQPPEMLRCPLAKLVLMAKVLDCGKPKELLGLAMDPPELHKIESTILNLKELGGLLVSTKGKMCNTDGEITFLGRIMANLPIDIPLARLIVLGQIFGVYESCLIIAAAMYVRNLLSAPFKGRLDAYMSKIAWAAGTNSDSIALLNAFKNWRQKKMSGYFERSEHGSLEEQWASDFLVQLRCTREVSDLVEELDGRLKQIGFVFEKKTKHQKKLDACDETLILKTVLAGAFYPNYFKSYLKNDKDGVRALADCNPYSTIYLTNFPLGQPGYVYTEAVKGLLAECSCEMKVTFDGTTKIYVQFPNTSHMKNVAHDSPFEIETPGLSSLAIYKALKLRQLGHKLDLNILPKSAAEKFLRKMDKRLNSKSRNKAVSSSSHLMQQTHLGDTVLPLLSTTRIEVKVVHVNSPSQFFVHIADEKNLTLLHKILNALNGVNCDLLPVSGNLLIGKLYAVPSFEAGETRVVLRAKVTEILPYDTCKVLFVDYGNTLVVKTKKVLELGQSLMSKGLHLIPHLALECSLAKVGPINRNAWSTCAISFFTREALGNYCEGNIFSVVDGVIRLELSCSSKKFNAELVALAFACKKEESFLSMENHRLRNECDDLTAAQLATHYANQYSYFNPSQQSEEKCQMKQPKPSDCTDTVNLKGPYSPLESEVRHLIRGGKHMAVNIEKNSVNSVLLNDDPLSPPERFLVAGNVHASQNKSRLILRDTTVMPAIPGILPLVCMLFAPKIEMRTLPGSNHYSGMICGLGYDRKTKVQLYPEHDMELVFDTAFHLKDLQEVNRIRFWMNFALSVDGGEMKPSNGPKAVAVYQKQAQSLLLRLLKQERQKIAPVNFADAYKWRKIDKELLIHPGKSSMDKSAVFPLHWGVLSEPAGASEYKWLKKILTNLENLSLRDELPRGFVECPCCNVTLHNIPALMEHFTCESHMEALEKMQQLKKSLPVNYH